MITMREPGEWIRRRYPATVDKMGKGTLYLTSRRLVFESEKYGMCLDLHFRWLYEWYPTGKRKYRMSWFEPHPETNDVRVTDKTFSADIVLERRSDKWKPDSIELHYALCFAYTEWTDDKYMQMGVYTGSDGKVRNHYSLAGPKQRTDDPPDFKGDIGRVELWLGTRTSGAQHEMAKYFKGMTGERLIDQEFRWRCGTMGVDEDGPNHTVLLTPRGSGKNVMPYEPDADRIKELVPDHDNSASDDVIRLAARIGLGRPSSDVHQVSNSIALGNIAIMVDEEEKNTTYRDSEEWKGARGRANRGVSFINFYKKLYDKLSGMSFETKSQVYGVIDGTWDPFFRDVVNGGNPGLVANHTSFDPIEQVRRLGLVNVVDRAMGAGWFAKMEARCKSHKDDSIPGHGVASHPSLDIEPVIGDMPEPKPGIKGDHHTLPKYRRLLVEAV